MTEKFQNKYRIPSTRLQGYDYGSHGLYFVTICTKNRQCYFGTIVETDNRPFQNKTIIINTDNCPSQNNPTTVETDNRPSQNKTIIINTDNCPSQNNPTTVETDNRPSLRPSIIGQIAIDYWMEIPKHYPFVELDEFVVMPNHIHGILFFNRPEKKDWQPNRFGVQSKNLGAVIRAYKSSVKRFANQNHIEFEWQPRYHDRIIRNNKELNAIRKYIFDNPIKWNNDALNVPQINTYANMPAVAETDNYPPLQQIIEQETENLLKEIGE